MSADKDRDDAASAALPPFPNYFELFQNIANPFMANAASNPSANPAHLMLSHLDPQEIERRIGELNTVLAWLKAQAGLVEMSLQTLAYQKSLLAQLAPSSSDAHADQGTASDLSSLAQTAANMNPALWAWNLMQQATSGEGQSPMNAESDATKARKTPKLRVARKSPRSKTSR
jgi:hypothetical protein